MSASEQELADPPTSERRRALWLQHAAGFMIFRDVRGYAIGKIDPDLAPECRAAALSGIDDALYGLMMLLDGVTGGLHDADVAVNLKVAVQLQRRAPSAEGDLIAEIDLFHGDGMCMGYHGWLKGDFGDAPIVKSDEVAGPGC